MSTGSPPVQVPLTWDEYRTLPDDGQRYEVIEGDLFVSPAPSPFHQTVSRRLQFAMMTQLEETGLALIFNAPIDLILEETTIVQPDLVVLRTSRKELITRRGIEGTPDLVVEILSPGTAERDRYIKRAVYARLSIPEYWVVAPDTGYVELHRLGEKGYVLQARFDRASTLTSPAFPELSIPLAPVFRPH